MSGRHLNDDELAACLRGSPLDDAERARYAPVVVALLAERQVDLRRSLNDAQAANAQMAARLLDLGDELVRVHLRTAEATRAA